MDKNKEIETKKKEEQMTEKEASAIFCKAFYDEAREIEARAQKVDLEVDEDRMEAMYQRMMAKMAADETAAGTNTPDETVEKDSGKVVTLSRKSPKHMLRWVAVLALVCAGVFGVSMQSQAGKDGLWSSIQRLIGVESRWEQKNNDENREYSDPEELKAVREIENELNIYIPEFFYWPENTSFESVEIDTINNHFVMTYTLNGDNIYFEGGNKDNDVSLINSWEGKGETETKKYDGIAYTVTEINEQDSEDKYYYVSWGIDEMEYSLSGIKNQEEIEKILENIKN